MSGEKWDYGFFSYKKNVNFDISCNYFHLEVNHAYSFDVQNSADFMLFCYNHFVDNLLKNNTRTDLSFRSFSFC